MDDLNRAAKHVMTGKTDRGPFKSYSKYTFYQVKSNVHIARDLKLNNLNSKMYLQTSDMFVVYLPVIVRLQIS